jgi:hypothetical protein
MLMHLQLLYEQRMINAISTRSQPTSSQAQETTELYHTLLKGVPRTGRVSAAVVRQCKLLISYKSLQQED